MIDNNYDPEKDVPNFVKQWIIAVRRKMNADQVFASASHDSIIALICTMNEYLKDKHDRIPVVQAITGLPITSTNLLTQHCVGTLIEEVKNGSLSNPTLISHIERLSKERTGRKAWDLFPWDAPQVSLPNLPETNPDLGSS